MIILHVISNSNKISQYSMNWKQHGKCCQNWRFSFFMEYCSVY